jgi:hypothetical protein
VLEMLASDTATHAITYGIGSIIGLLPFLKLGKKSLGGGGLRLCDRRFFGGISIHRIIFCIRRCLSGELYLYLLSGNTFPLRRRWNGAC